MSVFKKWLKKLVHNSYLDFAVGGILLVSGLWEAWETIPQDFASANLRASHGVIVLGLVTALKALTDMFAGLEFMDEAEYIEKKELRPRQVN